MYGVQEEAAKTIVEARKLEHHSPHALKEIIKDPSTNPPKPMFQLSEILYSLW